MKKLFLPLARIALLLLAFQLSLILLLVGAMQVESLRNEILARLSNYLQQQTGWSVTVTSIQEVKPFHWRLEGMTLQNIEGNKIFISSIDSSLVANQLLLGRLHFANTVLEDVQIDGMPPLGFEGSVTLFLLRRKLQADLQVDGGPNAPTKLELTVRKRSGRFLVDVLVAEAQSGLVHQLAGISIPIPFEFRSYAIFDSESDKASGHLHLMARDLEQSLGGELVLKGGFVWRPGQWSFTELEALFPNGRAQGAFQYRKDSIDGRFVATLPSLAPYQMFFPTTISGQIGLEGHLKGSLESPEMFLEVTSDQLKIADHLLLDQFTLQASGEWVDQEVNSSLELWCHCGSCVASAACHAVVSDSYVELDDIDFHLPGTTVQGDLSVDYASKQLRGQLTGEIPDLSFWTADWNPPLTGKVQVYASLADRYTLEIKGEAIQHNALQIDQLNLEMELENVLERSEGKAVLTAQKIKSGDLFLRSLSLETESAFKGAEWPFKLTAGGEWKGGLQLNVNGNVKLQDHDYLLTVKRFLGTLRDQSLSLESPLSLTAQNSRIQITPFRLRWGQGILEGHGLYDSKEMSGALKLEQLSLGLLSPLLTSVPLQGVLSGEAAIGGRPDNPEMHVKATGEKIAIANSELALLPPLRTTCIFDLRERELAVRGRLEGLGEKPLQLMATLPITLSLGSPLKAQFEWDKPMGAELHASGEISPLLEALAPGVTHLTGFADLALKLSGTMEKPVMGGVADLTGCTFESLDTGCVFKDIQASFEAQGNRMVVKDLKATDGEHGIITGEGIVLWDSIQGPLYDFRCLLQDVVLLRRDFVKSTGSGQLVFKGQGVQPLLSGEITLTALDVNIPQDSSAPPKAAVEITFINRPPGAVRRPVTSTASHPVNLDIQIHVPDVAHINGAELWSQWRGDLRLVGHTESPQLKGELKLSRGEFRINGKPFSLDKGKIAFNGDAEKDTTVSVLAVQEIDGGTIEAVLRGPIRAPVLSLRANPPMPQREILSWMLFGTGMAETSPFEASQLNKLALNVATASKSSKPGVLSRLQRLGIDRIHIDSTDDGVQNKVSLNIGKYLAKGLYVSVNKGLTTDGGSVSVEADVIRNVKLKGEVGDDAAGKMLLMWRHDY